MRREERRVGAGRVEGECAEGPKGRIEVPGRSGIVRAIAVAVIGVGCRQPEHVLRPRRIDGEAQESLSRRRLRHGLPARCAVAATEERAFPRRRIVRARIDRVFVARGARDQIDRRIDGSARLPRARPGRQQQRKGGGEEHFGVSIRSGMSSRLWTTCNGKPGDRSGQTRRRRRGAESGSGSGRRVRRVAAARADPPAIRIDVAPFRTDLSSTTKTIDSDHRFVGQSRKATDRGELVAREFGRREIPRARHEASESIARALNRR